jgi:DNA-binding GntR family transcriptional regulator
VSDHDELVELFERFAPLGTNGLKPSQAERIHRELRVQITLGELRPGTVIVEGALAEQFGASKTPVREALRQLQHEGLVNVLPRKGYVVSSFGLGELLDVYALRSLLQPPLAAAAARNSDERLLRELAAAATRDFEATTYLSGLVAGVEFQIVVAQAAGNRRAARMVTELLLEAMRFWLLVPPPPGKLQEALGFQRGVYAEMQAAMASHDDEAASRVMADVVELSRQEMAARMMSGGVAP